MPDAILFDLDDTLISLDGVTEKALDLACTDFQEAYRPPYTQDVMVRAINDVKSRYWSDPERHRLGRLDLDNTRRQLFLLAFQVLGYDNMTGAYELADSYGRYQDELTHIFPETAGTLQTLQRSGIRLGMVTNGSSGKQRAKIERFALERFFQIILVEEEVGFGKPDPRVYEEALSRLNLPASRVWMVGDNLVWDIESPQRLGIYSVWVNKRGKQLDENSKIVPDMVINDIAGLPGLIHNLSVDNVTN